MTTVSQGAPAATTSSEGFLLKLRERTGPLHRSLEELPLSRSLTDPAITREQYGQYLLALRPVVEQVETGLYPILSHLLPDMDRRKKLPLLDSDLTYLQIPINQAGSAPADGWLQTPTLSHAIGIVYVMEGSTLGGRMIIKNIQSSLGFLKNQGASYFTGYGDQTGPLWKSFLDALTRYEYLSGNGNDIIDGAIHAFQVIRQQISKPREL